MAHLGQSARIHKGFTEAGGPPLTLRAGFAEGGSFEEAYALGLFVLGESAGATSLSVGVAAVPALITFAAGSALILDVEVEVSVSSATRASSSLIGASRG